MQNLKNPIRPNFANVSLTGRLSMRMQQWLLDDVYHETRKRRWYDSATIADAASYWRFYQLTIAVWPRRADEVSRD